MTFLEIVADSKTIVNNPLAVSRERYTYSRTKAIITQQFGTFFESISILKGK